MHSLTTQRTIAAGAAVIAAALVLLLTRVPRDELPLTLPSIAAPAAGPEQAIARAPVEPRAARIETPAAATIRELEGMSETFRNSTFLIAIRDAGFVCNELLRVYGGIDDSGKWTATCSEMLAYTVSVAGGGTLHVEPMLQYFDRLVPVIRDQGADPAQRPGGRTLLDTLPPQPR